MKKAPLQITSETRFDYTIDGIKTSLTLPEFKALGEGADIDKVAPDWKMRQLTGLRFPRAAVFGRGYLGNDMGFDYMYRHSDGRLTAELPD